MMRTAASSSFASRAMITGDLPAKLERDRSEVLRSRRITSLPTDGDPVKQRWSNGSDEKAAPTSGPPVTAGDLGLFETVGDEARQQCRGRGGPFRELEHHTVARSERAGQRGEELC